MPIYILTTTKSNIHASCNRLLYFTDLIKQGLLARKQSIDLLDGLDLDFLSVGNFGNFGIGTGGDGTGSFGLDDDMLFSHHFDTVDGLGASGNATDLFRLSSGSFALSGDDLPSGLTAAALAAASFGTGNSPRGSGRDGNKTTTKGENGSRINSSRKSSDSGAADDEQRDWLRRASIDQTKSLLEGRAGAGSRDFSIGDLDDIEVDLSAYESLAASLQEKNKVRVRVILNVRVCVQHLFSFMHRFWISIDVSELFHRPAESVLLSLLHACRL